MHPTHLLVHMSSEALGWVARAWSWSKVCASLCRMRERAARNWITDGWLLALCLVWLWTLLASASLQPPTPTGLGEMVGPGERFPRILENWTPPRPFLQQADLL